MQGSGIEAARIAEGICSLTTIRNILGGKNYKRSLEYHTTNALAIWQLLLVVLFEEKRTEQTLNDCQNFRESLHHISFDTTTIYLEISERSRHPYWEETVWSQSNVPFKTTFIKLTVCYIWSELQGRVM